MLKHPRTNPVTVGMQVAGIVVVVVGVDSHYNKYIQYCRAVTVKAKQYA